MTNYDETPEQLDVNANFAENFGQDQLDTADAEETNRQELTAPAAAQEMQTTLYRAAGFWIRLLAFGIDLAVIACLNAIIWDVMLPIELSQSFMDRIILTNTLFLGLTGLAYFILMTYYYQQTLGKMITGIQVIQRSGEPLGWSTVIFRELVGRSLSQLMGLNFGYIVCWFNGEKRCLHDFLSDTWVVHVKPAPHYGYIAVDGEIA